MTIYYNLFFIIRNVTYKLNWKQSRYINTFPADINECEPTNDCMQKCTNSIGSYNCLCDDFFNPDPTDWRKCSRELFMCFFSLLESSCCVLFKLSATIHQVLYRIIVFPVIETIRTGFFKISRVRWVYEIKFRVRRTRPLFFCPLSTRVWKTVLQLLSTCNKLSLLPKDKDIPSLSRFSERFICLTHLCFFIAITPCSDDHVCEHVCYKGNNNKATCTCYANFELDSDGNTCRGTYNNYSKQWFNVLLQTRIIPQSQGFL